MGCPIPAAKCRVGTNLTTPAAGFSSVQLLQADEERAQQPEAVLPRDEDMEQAEPSGQHGCSIPSPGTSAGDGSVMTRDFAF